MQDGQDKDGNPLPADADGKPTTVDKAAPFTIDYKDGAYTTDSSGVTTFNYHPTAKSVLGFHKFNYVIVQACVAILILVGFESVTSMGEGGQGPEEAPSLGPSLLSLTIQAAPSATCSSTSPRTTSLEQRLHAVVRRAPPAHRSET